MKKMTIGGVTYLVCEKQEDIATAPAGSDLLVVGEWAGDVLIDGSAKVGSVRIDGTVTGSVLIYGTAKVGSVRIDGEPIAGAFADMSSKFTRLAAELPDLIAAIKGGKINGAVYEGECCCLVGTAEKSAKRLGVACPVARDSNSPAERWFLAIPPGHTPENNGFAREALRIAEEVLGGGA